VEGGPYDLTRVCIHLGMERSEFVTEAIAREIEAKVTTAAIEESYMNHRIGGVCK
jgi:hypothetical protein